MSIGGSTTNPFEISHGLKQECVLAPALFTLFLAALLSTVSGHLSAGVFIRTKSDGKVFQLARLKTSTKTRELCIRELLFADDAAIVAHTLEDTRQICKQFEQAATLFGLTINTKKTVTPSSGQTSIAAQIELISHRRAKHMDENDVIIGRDGQQRERDFRSDANVGEH